MLNSCAFDIGEFKYLPREPGPGKWVIVDIDNAWFNIPLVIGSSLSRAEEGKFWLNGDNDSLLGRMRMVALEWVPPDNNDFSSYSLFEKHIYGETQIAHQTYTYYRANWVIGGYTYGWYPPIPEEYKR